MAKALRNYGIHPKTVRLEGGATLKGYERDSFCDLWARYCPPFVAIPLQGVTAVTLPIVIGDSFDSQPSQAIPVSPSPRMENPRQSYVVTAVTPVTAPQDVRAERIFEGEL
jgi:hypothetical protein